MTEARDADSRRGERHGQHGPPAAGDIRRDGRHRRRGGCWRSSPDGDRYTLPGGGEAPLAQDVAALADFGADVVVDFTNAAWTGALLPAAVAAGVRPVIGTSGLSDALIAETAQACAARGLGGVIAANFALGAVMMMHLARVAAPFFDAVEVIEQHHDGKVDAPSGTAMATAQAMREARGRDFARATSRSARRCPTRARRSWAA